MKYCPKCNAEYQDWVKACSDCQEILAKEMPSKINCPDHREKSSDLRATSKNVWVAIRKNWGSQSKGIVLLGAAVIFLSFLELFYATRLGLRFLSDNNLFILSDCLAGFIRTVIMLLGGYLLFFLNKWGRLLILFHSFIMIIGTISRFILFLNWRNLVLAGKWSMTVYSHSNIPVFPSFIKTVTIVLLGIFVIYYLNLSRVKKQFT